MVDSYELMSALLALGLAQISKVFIYYLLDRKINLELLISTGGMPSSHTALTASLSTAMGITYGFNSPFFSLALVLTLIVAHDAAGVRWQAGKHASEINRLRQDFHKLVQSMSKHDSPAQNRQELKELLGHKPLEVFMGAIFGIVIAVLVHVLIAG